MKKVRGSVSFERAGIAMRVDDVASEDFAAIAAEMLDAVRLLTKTYAEVIPILDPVGAYHPVEYVDDDWAEDGRGRVGFRQTGSEKGIAR